MKLKASAGAESLHRRGEQDVREGLRHHHIVGFQLFEEPFVAEQRNGSSRFTKVVAKEVFPVPQQHKTRFGHPEEPCGVVTDLIPPSPAKDLDVDAL